MARKFSHLSTRGEIQLRWCIDRTPSGAMRCAANKTVAVFAHSSYDTKCQFLVYESCSGIRRRTPVQPCELAPAFLLQILSSTRALDFGRGCVCVMGCVLKPSRFVVVELSPRTHVDPTGWILLFTYIQHDCGGVNSLRIFPIPPTPKSSLYERTCQTQGGLCRTNSQPRMGKDTQNQTVGSQ